MEVGYTWKETKQKENDNSIYIRSSSITVKSKIIITRLFNCYFHPEKGKRREDTEIKGNIKEMKIYNMYVYT